MKSSRIFLSAIAGVALVAAMAAQAEDYKQGVAKVVRIIGQGEYAAAGSTEWHPISLGQYFSPGVSVRTPKNCQVDVVIEEGFDFIFRPDPHHSASPPPSGYPPPRGVAHIPPARQTVVRLMSGTTVELTKLDYYTSGPDTVSQTELNIKDGTIFFNVKKLSALSSFKMKTRISVAAIRGSSGWDSSNGDTGMVSGSEEVNGTYLDANGDVQTYTQMVAEGSALFNKYPNGNGGDSGTGSGTGSGSGSGSGSGTGNGTGSGNGTDNGTANSGTGNGGTGNGGTGNGGTGNGGTGNGGTGNGGTGNGGTGNGGTGNGGTGNGGTGNGGTGNGGTGNGGTGNNGTGNNGTGNNGTGTGNNPPPSPGGNGGLPVGPPTVEQTPTYNSNVPTGGDNASPLPSPLPPPHPATTTQ